jgi:PqqD family protein of HPr-rel-A system
MYPSDGEAVVFNADSGNAYHLNETAFAVWDGCDGRTTVGELANAVGSQFDVQPDIARDHVEQLLVVLAEAGLLSGVMDEASSS